MDTKSLVLAIFLVAGVSACIIPQNIRGKWTDPSGGVSEFKEENVITTDSKGTVKSRCIGQNNNIFLISSRGLTYCVRLTLQGSNLRADMLVKFPRMSRAEIIRSWKWDCKADKTPVQTQTLKRA